MGFKGLTAFKSHVLELTHHQRLCVHPSRRKERRAELQEDGATSDRDLPGPLPHIDTLSGDTGRRQTKNRFQVNKDTKLGKRS